MNRARRVLARRAVAARRLLLAAVALLALALPAGAAVAADCPKTTLAAVEAEVMCPVCGTPLGLATEAPQANRERAFIQRLVERCRSKEEIKEILVAQYGPGVLALPSPESRAWSNSGASTVSPSASASSIAWSGSLATCP